MSESVLKVDAYGTKRWYLGGVLHRVDGPAIECADGGREWYLNGVRHRVDGPAIEYANGDREWYLNGVRHRVDGPAIEYAGGHREWFFNGEWFYSMEFLIDAFVVVADLWVVEWLPIVLVIDGVEFDRRGGFDV